MVLNGTQTGVNHTMTYTDGAGLGFGADVQTAQNASFTVNGLSVSTANNTGLTDVVEGVTINLAADAEGKTAHLSVAANVDKSTAAMNAFVNKFNAAFTHLTQKMALTSSTNGTTTTYTRGPLSSDQGFRALRMDLFNQVNKNATNSGSFTSLANIGLSYDKDMKLTLDATKFAAALKSNSGDVTALLDSAMGNFNTLLTRYAGSKGSVQSSMASMDTQIKTYDQRISKYTESLTSRRQALIDQYFTYQNQLADLGNQAMMFGISLTGSSSSVNLLA
jgi:flagellar hook-associated protein 2